MRNLTASDEDAAALEDRISPYGLPIHIATDRQPDRLRSLVEHFAEMSGSIIWQCDETPQPHEAHYLKLDSSKARNLLNWKPRSGLQGALRKTLDWHEAWRKAEDMRAVTLQQIAHYTA